jgi:hypothetical protein
LILYAADRICTPESCITDSGVLAVQRKTRDKHAERLESGGLTRRCEPSR